MSLLDALEASGSFSARLRWQGTKISVDVLEYPCVLLTVFRHSDLTAEKETEACLKAVHLEYNLA